VGTELQLNAGRRRSDRPGGEPDHTILAMGLLTFATNVTLDGCVDHREGIADDETHDFFTRLMDASGAMLWGRLTYEMMVSYWPAVARGAEEAPPATREWAVKLEAKAKYVVSSTRKDFPWTMVAYARVGRPLISISCPFRSTHTKERVLAPGREVGERTGARNRVVGRGQLINVKALADADRLPL
jgi:hypothetical protein